MFDFLFNNSNTINNGKILQQKVLEYSNEVCYLKEKIEYLEKELESEKHKEYYIRCFFKAKYQDDNTVPEPPISKEQLYLENIAYLEKELKKLGGEI